MAGSVCLVWLVELVWKVPIQIYRLAGTVGLHDPEAQRNCPRDTKAGGSCLCDSVRGIGTLVPEVGNRHQTGSSFYDPY